MCVVKKPSIPKPSAEDQNKPLPILRNPFLDGLLGNIAALRNGRDSLRIPLNPLGIPIGGPPGSIGGGISAGGGTSSGGGGSSSSGGSTSGGSTSGGGSGGFGFRTGTGSTAEAR